MEVVHKKLSSRKLKQESNTVVFPKPNRLRSRKPVVDPLYRALGNQIAQHTLTNSVPYNRPTKTIPNKNGNAAITAYPYNAAFYTDHNSYRGRLNLSIQRKSNKRVSPEHRAMGASLINQLGTGHRLDSRIRQYFEPRFGHDLSKVRVFTGQPAADAAHMVNAQAFTIGNKIVFDKGEYQPHTHTGRQLLAHELAHTIQQRNITGVRQSRLRTARSDDVAEREADKAADSVLRGERSPSLSNAQNIIQRREARSTTPGEDNEVIIEMDDGQRYRVTRYRVATSQRRQESLPPEVTPGITLDDVTITIEWCRDTRGHVTIGANVPEQLRGIAGDIVDVIRRGGSSAEIREVFANADITAFINFVIAHIGEWEIFGGAHVTVGATGVTAGGGRFGVRRGDVRVFAQGQGSEEGWQVTGNVAVDLPEERREEPCPTRERVTEGFRNYYHCDLYRPEQREPRTREEPRTDTQTHFIYFEFERSRVLGQAGQRRGSEIAMRNAPEMVAILDKLANGYRVTRIKAYASPEGLRTRRPRGRFQGNDALARDRSQAARDWINNHCPLSGGVAGHCTQSAQMITIPPAESERFAPPDISGQEVTGRPLQEHAVSEFLTSPEEERHRTEVLVEQIARARTPEQQAALVYPLLRRAEITLEKTTTVQVPYVHVTPGGYSSTSCPADVVNEAGNYFRGRR